MVDVRPALAVSLTSQPSHSSDRLFTLDLTLENIAATTAVEVTQVSLMSPTWSCTPLSDYRLYVPFSLYKDVDDSA